MAKNKRTVDSRKTARTKKSRNNKPRQGPASCGLDKIPFEEIESLSMVEMRDLYFRMLDGDTVARNRLAMSVSRFALCRAAASSSKQAPLEELFQEAMCTLLADMHKYDPSRGSVTTFANWRIFGAIQRIYAHTKDVRIPPSLEKIANEIDKRVIANGGNVAQEDDRLQAAHEVLPDDPEKAEKAARAQPRGVYFSSETCDSITASIKYSYEEDYDSEIDKNSKIAKVKEAFDILTKSEAKALELFLEGNTLNKSAKKMGTTTEAIRKLERKAVAKIAEKFGRFQQIGLRSQREL